MQLACLVCQRKWQAAALQMQDHFSLMGCRFFDRPVIHVWSIIVLLSSQKGKEKFVNFLCVDLNLRCKA